MSDKVQRVTDLPKLSVRQREGHKGDYGRVLIVGGSRGMIGAPALAANAALRGGAGLVTFAAPEAIQQSVATLCPCATSLPLSCGTDGRLGGNSIRELASAAARCDVLGVGPGMDQGQAQAELVRVVLQGDKPIVLDADGLNNLKRIDAWANMRGCGLVLTPHPGELSRLTGRTVAGIQSDREGAVMDAVKAWTGQGQPREPLICALKGAGTIVTDAERIYVNQTGNPGMASGGTGDVLTGLIAALIAQGLELFEAACLGVHVHGRAGDLAAEKLGQVSVTASDLLDFLPSAMKEAAS